MSTNNLKIVPATEVRPKASRRRLTVEYKLRILHEADACTESGQVGALLRREGLHSSQLCEWRKAQNQGRFDSTESQRRGPKPKLKDPRDKEIEQLKKALQRSETKLWRAEQVIALQKKVAEILGRPYPAYNERDLPPLPEDD